MGYLLGIDIGTSGTKTCLYRLDGSLAASAFAEYPLLQPHPGWAEQRPEEWWQAAVQTIRQVLKKSGVEPREITGVGLSGQMHGLVLLGKQGQVLRPAIIWCDQRTEEQVKWMEEHLGAAKVIACTANVPLPNFTATKLLWVRDHEPEMYEQIDKVLLPKDYIRYKLTGEFATEVSDASGTLWLDVAHRCWSDEMINGLGVEKSWLPALYESYQVTGYIHAAGAEESGLAIGTPVVGGGGDQAAGAVGNGIVRKDLVSVTIGTSGVVFAASEQLRLDAMGRLHSFCHAVPGMWHLMGVTQAAGGSMQWFRNQFGQQERDVAARMQKDPYQLFSEEAANVPAGSEGLLFLPYLMGERTPHLDPAAKGVFFGITARHTKSHFIRSIMEGVAYSLADCLELFKQSGFEISEIRASGGGARSELWRYILANVFDHDLITIQANEGPAFGAALLAGVGTKQFDHVQQACEQTIRLASHVLPERGDVLLYQAYRSLYQKLYQDVKENFRLLHDLVSSQHH